MDNYNFVVQCWDRDFFASNDLIGECNLDLKPLIEDVIETNRSFQFSKKYYEAYLKDLLPQDLDIQFEKDDEDSFWIPCKGKDEATGEIKIQGYVKISINVLPKDQ